MASNRIDRGKSRAQGLVCSLFVILTLGAVNPSTAAEDPYPPVVEAVVTNLEGKASVTVLHQQKDWTGEVRIPLPTANEPANLIVSFKKGDEVVTPARQLESVTVDGKVTHWLVVRPKVDQKETLEVEISYVVEQADIWQGWYEGRLADNKWKLDWFRRVRNGTLVRWGASDRKVRIVLRKGDRDIGSSFGVDAEQLSPNEVYTGVEHTATRLDLDQAWLDLSTLGETPKGPLRRDIHFDNSSKSTGCAQKAQPLAAGTVVLRGMSSAEPSGFTQQFAINALTVRYDDSEVVPTATAAWEPPTHKAWIPLGQDPHLRLVAAQQLPEEPWLPLSVDGDEVRYLKAIRWVVEVANDGSCTRTVDYRTSKAGQLLAPALPFRVCGGRIEVDKPRLVNGPVYVLSRKGNADERSTVQNERADILKALHSNLVDLRNNTKDWGDLLPFFILDKQFSSGLLTGRRDDAEAKLQAHIRGLETCLGGLATKAKDVSEAHMQQEVGQQRVVGLTAALVELRRSPQADANWREIRRVQRAIDEANRDLSEKTAKSLEANRQFDWLIANGATLAVGQSFPWQKKAD